MERPSSHGAAYADLINMASSIVVNNIDAPAFIYQNVGIPVDEGHPLAGQLQEIQRTGEASDRR
jgi:hypothetical protein